MNIYQNRLASRIKSGISFNALTVQKDPGHHQCPAFLGSEERVGEAITGKHVKEGIDKK